MSTYSLAVRESDRLIKPEIEDRMIPRLDATLLWKIQSGLINTVEFASGDAGGTMLIQAKGFDIHGNWISGKKQFLIKE